jgi:hypothetical protein
MYPVVPDTPAGIVEAPPPILTVMAPFSMSAGSTFVVTAPNGEQLAVQMPPGVQPGTPFQVLVPPHVLLHPQPATAHAVPVGTPVVHNPPVAQLEELARAKTPTPSEMQRIGNAWRSQKGDASDGVHRPPPLVASHCTCISEVEPKGTFQLPEKLMVGGCITNVKLDLRQHEFANGSSMTIDQKGCITGSKLIVPPEVNVVGSPCGCITASPQITDRRPKQLRGTRPAQTKVVHINGCTCIGATEVTVLEHGQPTPRCVIS